MILPVIIGKKSTRIKGKEVQDPNDKRIIRGTNGIDLQQAIKNWVDENTKGLTCKVATLELKIGADLNRIQVDEQGNVTYG